MAAALEAGGFFGKRGECRDCPLARFLTAAVGCPVEVHDDEIVVVVQPSWKYSFGHFCKTTTFVQKFDSGEFPALDSEERTKQPYAH